jgi:hypothetical protein
LSGKAHLQGLMAEIGPLLELGEVVAFDDQAVWTLVVDTETVVFADYDEADERLWLSAEIGPPPAGSDRAGLYETLLTYNNSWRETGGLRVSLDEPGAGGALSLAYDLPAAALELSRFRLALAGFLDALRAWREGLANIASGAAPPDLTEAPFNPFLSGAFRA